MSTDMDWAFKQGRHWGELETSNMNFCYYGQPKYQWAWRAGFMVARMEGHINRLNGELDTLRPLAKIEQDYTRLLAGTHHMRSLLERMLNKIDLGGPVFADREIQEVRDWYLETLA